MDSTENGQEQCSHRSQKGRGQCSMPAKVSQSALFAKQKAAKQVTYSDELKGLQVRVRTAACTLERLLNAQASRADAVGDVDDARELLELPEEAGRDQAIVGRLAQERKLGRMGDSHSARQQKAAEGAHEEVLSHNAAAVERGVVMDGAKRGESVRSEDASGVRRAIMACARQQHWALPQRQAVSTCSTCYVIAAQHREQLSADSIMAGHGLHAAYHMVLPTLQAAPASSLQDTPLPLASG